MKKVEIERKGINKAMNKLWTFLKSHFIAILIGIAVAWVMIAFLIYPNINVVANAFIKDGKFSFDAVRLIFKSDRAVKGLWNSILLAFTLSITVNVVGVFIVLASSYFELKGSKILNLGYMSTLIYGGIVLVSGYVFTYGNNGILTSFIQKIFPSYNPEGWFSGYLGVVFVMTFSITSNHMIFLRNAIKKVDYNTIEAAKNLGASNFRILRTVVLPILLPTILAVTILVFLSGLGAYAAPLLVGGDKFETLAPLIRALVYDSPDISLMLSIILGALAIGLLILFTKVEKKRTYYSSSKTQGTFKKQKIENKFANVVLHIFAYLVFLIYALPIVLIIIFSFTNGATIASGNITWNSFTLKNYITVLSDVEILIPLFNSIRFSIVAAVIVVFFILFLVMFKFKKKNKLTGIIQYVLMIPWLLPAVVIAMGLVQTYNVPNFLVFGRVLVGTTAILIIGYIIMKIPFTYRILNAIYYTVDDSYENASKSLGAKPFYTFRRVTLPMILPTVLALIVINFNGLISDYNLTVFLYHPLYRTLGLDIKSKTDSMAGGDVQVTLLVYTVVLMIFSALTLYFAYGKLLKGKGRDI